MFSHSTKRRHESSPHGARLTLNLPTMYASLLSESSLPSSRGVGCLCLEVSIGTWKPDPFCIDCILRSEMTSFSIQQKAHTKMDQAVTPQTRPPGTDHLRASNLPPTTLCSVEHAPSKYRSNPCSVRRALGGGGQCCVEKHVFLLTQAGFGTGKRVIALCGFQHHKGEPPVSVSVVRSHKNRP